MNIARRFKQLTLAVAILAVGTALATAGEPEQYVIERSIPDAGNLTSEELREISAKSNAVLAELGDDIRWVHSYVSEDTVYCVYEARDPELIQKHAEKGGFPADRISRVSRIIDPTTGD